MNTMGDDDSRNPKEPPETFLAGLVSPNRAVTPILEDIRAAPIRAARTLMNSIPQDALVKEAISLEEFNELYNIEFELNPKDLRISTTFDESQEPFFNVNLIARMKFNTITFWNERKRNTKQINGKFLRRSPVDGICQDLRSSHFQKGIEMAKGSDDEEEDEQILLLREMNRTLSGNVTYAGEKDKSFAGDTSIEEFNMHHLLPIPTLRSINHSAYPDSLTTCHLKKQKVDEDKKERLHKLMEKATAGNGKEYFYDLKIVTYEAVQVYRNFSVSFDGYTQNTKRFPLDIHHVQFSVTFNPFLTYSDRDKEYFELKVGKNKGRLLYRKDNYYPKVQTLIPFPPHSHLFADERILKLDIIPESLRINKFDYGVTKSGEKKLKKDALIISFALHRIIAPSFINLFLPIYIISILVPFSCLFFKDNDCDEDDELYCAKQRFADNDLTATYLSALLLTLVAHRSVIASSQSATNVYTMCDIDFTISLFLILFQMFFLNSIIFDELIDFNKTENLIQVFRYETLLLLVLWIVPRCYWFFIGGMRNMIRRPILIKEYMDLRRDMQLFRMKNTTLQRKTFFSTNIKLITSYISKQRRKTIRATTPIEDLYRLRLYNNEKDQNTLVEIKMHPYITEEYTEKLCENRVRTVYSLTTRWKKLLLEVECTSEQRDKRIVRKLKLEEYAQNKKKELSKVEELGKLTKTKARFLFLQSVVIEIACMFSGQGLPINLIAWKSALKNGLGICTLRKRVRDNWMHIQEDWKLLKIVLELLSHAGNEEVRRGKVEEVKEFFQKL